MDVNKVRNERYERFKGIRDMFTDCLVSDGFQVSERQDTWMPELIAHKKDRMCISMIQFLDPYSAPSVSVVGRVSSADIGGFFYFCMGNAFDNWEERFLNLMKEVAPYAHREMKEDRRSF